MNRWSRLIIIFVAYGLALLHTAVPHQHGQGSQGQPVISHGGCVLHGSIGGLLQMVLSTDLGVGHLETFKKGGDADINFSSVGVSFIFILTSLVFFPRLPDRYCERLGTYIEKLHKRLILFSSRHLRAPPVLV